jgi:hypothetical protein
MNDEPEHTAVEWECEAYGPKASTELLQLLYDSGLMYQVNCAVLHPQGLALGVSVEDDTGRVTGLNLYRTSDPEGVWYDEELTKVGRQKLLRFGLLLTSSQRESK